jgi:lipoprotein-anchoring transpeptidase ErfK/SrfK
MWIDINLTTQKLSAYNVGGLVLSTPISSGKRGFATIQGKFQVTRKVLSQRLAGRLHGEIWDIPNVPFIMYFSGSFAIHGAYWHNDFGHPVSHGCVNVPVNYGALLYSWTPIGTTVVIHK